MARKNPLTHWLRHKILIEQPSEINTFGEITETWSTFLTTRGRVEPLNGREYFQLEQVGSEIDVRITLRYHAGITPKMRVSYGTRYFDIISVINVNEVDNEIVLMCKEHGY